LIFIDFQTFVDLVFLPCLNRGRVEDLLEYIARSDSTCKSWTYLLAACCQFLEERGNERLLLHLQVGPLRSSFLLHTILQLFMKDYFRAAQSCITLFNKKSLSPNQRRAKLLEAKV
jgi:hypothetical protein